MITNRFSCAMDYWEGAKIDEQKGCECADCRWARRINNAISDALKMAEAYSKIDKEYPERMGGAV